MQDPAADPLARFANLFVVIALVSMLIGAILIIGARETHAVDLEPGEEAVLYTHRVPSWDPLGSRLSVRVLSPGNFTLGDAPDGVPNETVIRIEERTQGRLVREDDNGTLAVGADIWRGTGQPGEEWTVSATNHGDRLARVGATVACGTCYVAGGVFVALGVLGFVAYRIGVRRSD